MAHPWNHKQMHIHRAAVTESGPFQGPVGFPHNKAAHGGRTLVHTCICGARQMVNLNGAEKELSFWHHPPK